MYSRHVSKTDSETDRDQGYMIYPYPDRPLIMRYEEPRRLDRRTEWGPVLMLLMSPIVFAGLAIVFWVFAVEDTQWVVQRVSALATIVLIFGSVACALVAIGAAFLAMFLRR
jgi:hypothetical protein